MLLRVTVHAPDDLEKWLAAEQKSAESNPDLCRDKAVFESLSCVNCHSVRGTSRVGKFGSSLTHLMTRQTLGAGALTNTTAHLRAWVKDLQHIERHCFVPNMKLKDKALYRVVSYSHSLK